MGLLRRALHYVANVIREMRSHGRRWAFIGLTSTSLSDADALLIGAALGGQPRLDRDEVPETLEMLQMDFKPETRRALLCAAERAGVNLLLSHPNGPALRAPALRAF